LFVSIVMVASDWCSQHSGKSKLGAGRRARECTAAVGRSEQVSGRVKVE